MTHVTDVLVKPLITEKTNILSDKKQQYTFVVTWNSTKDEIKKAVEEMFNVRVAGVSTLKMPAKTKVKYTSKGVSKGRKSAYKKAIITCVDGDNIDFYSI